MGVGDPAPVPDLIAPGLGGARGPHCPTCRLCPRLLRHRGSGHLRLFCAGPSRRRSCGHLCRLRPRLPYRGGGVVRGGAVEAGEQLAGDFGGLGGDQAPHIGVDVVDGQGVVVLGVVRRHLLDAGGMHRTAWTSGCGASPPPFPRLLPFPFPLVPGPCPPCPRWPM